MAALRVGTWVEVRSAEEIFASLDGNGCVKALPFMPEMLQYCGKRFRVYKSAHKTCTPPSLLLRTIDDTVHLEGLRCDGQAHGGCQAGCLIFWKEAWLRPVDGPAPQDQAAAPPPQAPAPEVLLRATRRPPAEGATEELYRCQSTDLVHATRAATWWSPGMLLKDLTSGNVSLLDLLRYGSLSLLNAVLGLLNRRSYPFLRPRSGDKTPSAELDLQPGEQVVVRSEDEIMGTLNERKKNRGLRFDVEMWPYCGKSVSVLGHAGKFIDERSGRMIQPKNPCLILDEVVCSGNYSKGRMFCSRSIYSYWHEVWLRRAEPEAKGPANDRR